MWNNFFKHIDIDPANAHILDGNADDLEVECQAFEQKIAEAGGIELFVGGQTFCENEACPETRGVWEYQMFILTTCPVMLNTPCARHTVGIEKYAAGCGWKRKL